MVSDLVLSETAQLSDVVLPTAHWAEEDGTTTNLEGRVLLRRRAVGPPAGVLAPGHFARVVALAGGDWTSAPLGDHAAAVDLVLERYAAARTVCRVG